MWALSTQFAGREVEKVYHAIVCGRFIPERGDIRRRLRVINHRKRMAVTDGSGAEAGRSYRVRERLREPPGRALLHTGRTHQIRVHFKHLGFPSWATRLTAIAEQRVSELTGYARARQMLHAHQTRLQTTAHRKKMTFVAAAAGGFQRALQVLR